MKKVMTFLFFFTTLTMSFNVFAVSDDELVSICYEAGQQKISTHAQVLGCKVNLNDIEASEIDNRWYNPSKYIWYVGVIECKHSTYELEKMVQYYAGKCL